MGRAAHIAFALLAVILLVRPFDCFSSGKLDKKAVDCCKKGKCTPSNSDSCCRATVPGGNRLVKAQATDHAVPVLTFLVMETPCPVLQISAMVLFAEIHQPPGSPPDLRLNLPLLV